MRPSLLKVRSGRIGKDLFAVFVTNRDTSDGFLSLSGKGAAFTPSSTLTKTLEGKRRGRSSEASSPSYRQWPTSAATSWDDGPGKVVVPLRAANALPLGPPFVVIIFSFIIFY